MPSELLAFGEFSRAHDLLATGVVVAMKSDSSPGDDAVGQILQERLGDGAGVFSASTLALDLIEELGELAGETAFLIGDRVVTMVRLPKDLGDGRVSPSDPAYSEGLALLVLTAAQGFQRNEMLLVPEGRARDVHTLLEHSAVQTTLAAGLPVHTLLRFERFDIAQWLFMMGETQRVALISLAERLRTGESFVLPVGRRAAELFILKFGLIGFPAKIIEQDDGWVRLQRQD